MDTKVGDIVRYGKGETELLLVKHVLYRHNTDGFDHYHGIDFFGGQRSASARHCEVASEKDQEKYRQQRGLSKEPV